MLYLDSMIIDNKELTKLVEKEAKLLAEIKEVTDVIKEHSDAISRIRKENEVKLKEAEELKAQIGKIFIPIVIKEKEEYETFGNPEVVDGKVSIELTDQRPRTLEEAEENLKLRIKQGDDMWLKYASNVE